MKLSLSLTQRYLLFLAAVITTFIIGSQLITSRIVRTGLVDLFRQRFDRAQVVLDQHETSHRLAKSTELESVLNSPRFIAAVETGDSATISAEMPIYQRVLAASLVVVTDNQGRLMFASDSTHSGDIQQIKAGIQAQPDQLQIQYLKTSDQILELLLSRITNSAGTSLGWIAEGSPVSTTLAEDLKRLTGFDVIVSLDGRVLGTTTSPLMTALNSQPEQLARLCSGERLMTEIPFESQELIYSSLVNSPSSAVVTFVTSLDEHISPIKRQITLYLILFAVAGGLLAMMVIYLFTSRRIGRQIDLLVTAAEQISEGNLDSPIQAKSKDELGYLAGEFESMRVHLRESRHEIERAHATALSAERLAAIGKLATGIIHDFKNPMAVIRGTVDLIRARDKENEKLARYCTTVHEQVDRMVDLTRDVLDYSRGESRLALSETPLSEYFDSIKSFHEAPYKLAGIELTLHGPADLAARIDRNRFRRVIDNILNNAREALKPGDHVRVSWRLSAEHLAIELADNGPGIPEQIKTTLFEPFVTSNKEGGTGLGLAIAKKIVEDHGGVMRVESARQRGTTFVIELPASLAVTSIVSEAIKV